MAVERIANSDLENVMGYWSIAIADMERGEMMVVMVVMVVMMMVMVMVMVMVMRLPVNCDGRDGERRDNDEDSLERKIVELRMMMMMMRAKIGGGRFIC